MGIARSTYYAMPEAKRDDTALVEAMAAICAEFEAYGWRRVQAALRLQGIVANHKKIKRLMREHAPPAENAPPLRPERPTAVTTNRSSPIVPEN
jgi:putative transposase